MKLVIVQVSDGTPSLTEFPEPFRIVITADLVGVTLNCKFIRAQSFKSGQANNPDGMPTKTSREQANSEGGGGF